MTIFNFTMCKSETHSVETSSSPASSEEKDRDDPGAVTPHHPAMLQPSWPSAFSTTCINGKYPSNHSVFTFSTVFNYMRYLTLYYKTGFVLDDFA